MEDDKASPILEELRELGLKTERFGNGGGESALSRYEYEKAQDRSEEKLLQGQLDQSWPLVPAQLTGFQEARRRLFCKRAEALLNMNKPRAALRLYERAFLQGFELTGNGPSAFKTAVSLILDDNALKTLEEPERKALQQAEKAIEVEIILAKAQTRIKTQSELARNGEMGKNEGEAK